MQYLGNQAVQVIGRTDNLIPFPYSSSHNMTSMGWTCNVNVDGSLSIKGTPTGYVAFTFVNRGAIKPSTTYTISFGIDVSIGSKNLACAIALYDKDLQNTRNLTSLENSYTFTTTENECFVTINVKRQNNIATDVTIYPMLNEGSTALPYQPYIQRYDMYMYDNLVKMPYDTGNTTINGVTFTVDEETGYVTMNGTASKVTYFYFNAIRNLSVGRYWFKEFVNDKSGLSPMIAFKEKSGAQIRNFTIEYFPSCDITPADVRAERSFGAQVYIASGTVLENRKIKLEVVKLIGE